MAVGLDPVSSSAWFDSAPIWAVNGPFEDSPWIVEILGWAIAVALLVAIIAWSVFALADILSRSDIGAVKKLLWLVAFILSAGIVWVVYGAVRFSHTDGTPGG